jgi:MoaA/NifB/PqqE/SkfB family radical SAM enzyme
MNESDRAPLLPLGALDALWFQIAGTLCNLRCNHCFISCAPDNHTLELMPFAEFKRHLDDSVRLGVKEYYFTGGEPFIHPQILEILETTLAVGPATVLTNATRFDEEKVAILVRLREASIYSLEIRVSIDGFSPETNDPIRGPGTFDRAMEGVRLLVAGGFFPIITSMRSWPMHEDDIFLREFRARLAAIGYTRPRMKLLPALKIGQEELRDHGYGRDEFVTERMMRGYDIEQLLCRNSRVVSARGVHVCPILVDQPDANLGPSLTTAAREYQLRHHACVTCYRFGALCSNASSLGLESSRLVRGGAEANPALGSAPNER